MSTLGDRAAEMMPQAKVEPAALPTDAAGRAGRTAIVAASLSTEPQELAMRAQNCVVCVNTGLAMVCPEPTCVDVSPFAPRNQLTVEVVPMKPTVSVTVVPATAS